MEKIHYLVKKKKKKKKERKKEREREKCELRIILYKSILVLWDVIF